MIISSEDFNRYFSQLSLEKKILLWTLGVYYSTDSKNRLIERTNKALFHFVRNIKITPKILNEFLQELHDLHISKSPHIGYAMLEDEQHSYILQSLFASPEGKSVRDHLTDTWYSFNYAYNTDRKALRYKILGQFYGFSNRYVYSENERKRALEYQQIANLLGAHPPIPMYWDPLDQKDKGEFLLMYFLTFSTQFSSKFEIWEPVLQQYLQEYPNTDHSSVTYYFGKCLFLSGRFEEISKIIHYMKGYERFFTKAMLFAKTGDFNKAIANWEEGLIDFYRGHSKAYKLPSDLYTCIMMLIYEYNKPGLGFKFFNKLYTKDDSISSYALNTVWQIQDFIFKTGTVFKVNMPGKEGLDLVMVSLLCEVYGSELKVPIEIFESVNENLSQKELQNSWLSNELNKAFRKLNDGYLSPEVLTHCIPFDSATPSSEKWRMVFETLENVVSEFVKSDTDKRLIWVIDPTTSLIYPLEQKRNKNGSWSKGKRIAISTFYKMESRELNSDDARLKNAVVRSSNYWENELLIDFSKGLDLLSGKKNVFREGAVLTPMEIRSVRPKIRVKRNENQSFFLETFPKTATQTINYELSSYNLIEICTLDKVQTKIINALSGLKLVFPPDAIKSLADWLKKVKDFLDIVGDIPESLSDQLLPMETSKCLNIKMIQDFGESMEVEVRVKPVSSINQYFLPSSGESRYTVNMEGNTYAVNRDLQNEKLLWDKLLSFFDDEADLKRIIAYNFSLLDPGLMILFFERIRPMVAEGEISLEVIKSNKQKKLRFIEESSVKLRLNSGNNWISIGGEDVEIDEEKVVSFKDMLEYSKMPAGSFVEVDENTLVLMSNSLRRMLRSVSLSGVEGKNEVKLHPLLASFIEQQTEEFESVSKSKKWSDELNRIHSLEKSEHILPEKLNAILRSYQVEGYQWLAKRADQGLGSCLADDMGLGKTLQSIAVLLKRAEFGPAIVIAPTSVCGNWQEEFQKFAPDLKVFNLYEEDRSLIQKDWKPGEVLICSYGLLTREIDKIEKIAFISAVLDEAQAIKNPDAQRSKAACRIQASARWVTTGTPIENRLLELWSIFEFLNPGLLGNQTQFKTRFIQAIELNKDAWVAEQLRMIIQPFLLRRTKKEVLVDLPPKTEVNRMISLSRDEMSFYEAIRQKAQQEIASAIKEGNKGEQHLKILAVLTRLRLAACNASLVDEDVQLPSSKLQELTDLLAEILDGGHKVLVFSQFVKHLKIVSATLKTMGVPFFYLDGGTTPSDRSKMIQEFDVDKTQVFLLSLKAGGTGINLTAASYIIHLDPWWNPAVEDQATDRAHRIGQNQAVTVYRLIAKNTIEEKIIKLHQSKRDLADQLISGQTGNLLDLDTLRDLVMESF